MLFWSPQNADTSFTLGRNCIFRPPKCIKWATRKYVPLNHRFHDSPKIEIIRLPKCRKWARGCHVPMNRGFYDPPKIAPCVSLLRRKRTSGHQNAENELIETYVPLNLGFHVSEKSHFQVSKMKKTKRSNLEQWVTRLGKNRIFMPPECRKWAYTKICTLEPFV